MMKEKLNSRPATGATFRLHPSNITLKFFSLGLVSLLLMIGFSSTFVEAAPPTLQIGSTSSLSGTLTMIWGDPAPNSSRMEETLYSLTDDAGQTYQLEINPKTVQAPNGLVGLYNKRVKLTATVTNVPAAGSSPSLSVQAIDLDNTPGARTAPGATPGSNPFISVMCRYAGNTSSPQPQTFFTNQLSNTKPGFDNYIRELSYGQYNLTGSKAVGWFDLPHPRNFYVDGVKTPTTYLNELAQDCTAAANAGGVNFASPTQYYGINLMFNDGIDFAAWGGSSFLTLNGISKVWRTTWMPYTAPPSRFGWYDHRVLAHEMSHAFGSPHSGSSIAYQYGSSWDIVSYTLAHCADAPGVNDPTYGCVGQHVIANNKDFMQFIPAGRKFSYTGSAPQTVTLERVALPPSNSSFLMAQIPIAGSPNKYYTVETRFRIGYDIKLPPADGVIIHDVNLNRVDAQGFSLPAILVAPPGVEEDALNWPNGGGPRGVGDLNALWPVGSTFTDTTNNIRIRIDSVSAANGTAVITINPVTVGSLEVTSANDSGPGSVGTSGTLSFALTNAVNGQSITFNLPGNGTTVNVSGTLPTPKPGVIIDGGNCNAGPRITIQGSGANTATGVNGLVLNKGVTVKNLRVIGFGGKQILATVANGSGSSNFKCVKMVG